MELKVLMSEPYIHIAIYLTLIKHLCNRYHTEYWEVECIEDFDSIFFFFINRGDRQGDQYIGTPGNISQGFHLACSLLPKSRPWHTISALLVFDE